MKQRAFLLSLFALSLILIFTGALSAKEIKTLSQFPMSGPVGSLPEFGWGFIDGMKWVNGEGGGVNGKKIQWFLEDMRYNTTPRWRWPISTSTALNTARMNLSWQPDT
jgi:hypothetical protein